MEAVKYQHWSMSNYRYLQKLVDPLGHFRGVYVSNGRRVVSQFQFLVPPVPDVGVAENTYPDFFIK